MLETFYKAKILVVDDEQAILTNLKRQLKARGYEVTTAGGGREALQEIAENLPDLVILDLMMPGIDGLEVTRQIRQKMRSRVPIIVLSARDEMQKKVEALDLGADDYLTKPFGLDELLARIRVALRHTSQLSETAAFQTPPTTLGNQQLTIDLASHRVLRDGQEVKLTPKQYDVLKYLALHPDKLLTHQLILQAVWGSEYSRESQYVHVVIGQLRQKLEANPAKPQYIITEPGLGYRFHLPEGEKL